MTVKKISCVNHFFVKKLQNFLKSTYTQHKHNLHFVISNVVINIELIRILTSLQTEVTKSTMLNDKSLSYVPV